MSFVDLCRTRRRRTLVLELVRLGRVPEDGVVQWRNFHILNDSSVLSEESESVTFLSLERRCVRTLTKQEDVQYVLHRGSSSRSIVEESIRQFPSLFANASDRRPAHLDFRVVRDRRFAIDSLDHRLEHSKVVLLQRSRVTIPVVWKAQPSYQLSLPVLKGRVTRTY